MVPKQECQPPALWREIIHLPTQLHISANLLKASLLLSALPIKLHPGQNPSCREMPWGTSHNNLLKLAGKSLDLQLNLMENKSLETEHRQVICVANVQQMSQKINPYDQCSFCKCYLHVPTKSMIKPPGQGPLLWKKTASPSSLSFYKMETKTFSSSIRKASICILEVRCHFPQTRSPLWGKVMRPRYTSKKSTKATNVHKWQTMILSGSLTLRPWK